MMLMMVVVMMMVMVMMVVVMRLRGLSPIYGHAPFVIITKNLKCSIGHLCINDDLWADLRYVSNNQWVDDDADDGGGDDDDDGDDGAGYEASRLISDIWARPVCNNHQKSEMFHRSFMH